MVYNQGSNSYLNRFIFMYWSIIYFLTESRNGIRSSFRCYSRHYEREIWHSQRANVHQCYSEEDFRDTIFSSVTVEILSGPYDWKAFKEETYGKKTSWLLLKLFFCRFNFSFRFLILCLAADRLELLILNIAY